MKVGTTQEEWDKTVDDLYKLCVSIPQLQGLVAMIEVIAKVSKVAFPLLDAVVNNEDTTENKPKLKMIRTKISESLTDEEIVQAENTVKFLSAVNVKLAEAKGATVQERDTSWTEEFFNQY